MESLMLLLVFIGLLLALVAYITYRAYQIGLEAGAKVGYGSALQDFLHQQAHAAEQQQMYEQQQMLAAQKEAEMEARAIGFSTSKPSSEEEVKDE